jgi:hypothetical protein
MIVGTQEATRVFRNVAEATIDAEDNVVYEGIVAELVHDQLLAHSEFEEAREFILLRRMLKKIAPLSLNDPQSAGFKASNCRSYHDIIRFAHEKAVQCLSEGSCLDTSQAAGRARRLELNVPLDLIVLDLGGGLRSADGASKTAGTEDITCAPLRPLIDGGPQPATEPGGCLRQLPAPEPEARISLQYHRLLPFRAKQRQLYLFPLRRRCNRNDTPLTQGAASDSNSRGIGLRD